MKKKNRDFSSMSSNKHTNNTVPSVASQGSDYTHFLWVDPASLPSIFKYLSFSPFLEIGFRFWRCIMTLLFLPTKNKNKNEFVGMYQCIDNLNIVELRLLVTSRLSSPCFPLWKFPFYHPVSFSLSRTVRVEVDDHEKLDKAHHLCTQRHCFLQ